MDRKKTWKRVALLVTNSLHSDNSGWPVNNQNGNVPKVHHNPPWSYASTIAIIHYFCNGTT